MSEPSSPSPGLAARILGRHAPIALAAAAGLMLATWLPHYLTWPWWPDLDAYATIARGWDAGVRPYRDVVIFNFPGQIEVFWLLGRTFGWGKTAPFYAFDAGLLLLLGGVLVAWSRRLFGSTLPGLVGLLAVLVYYLNLDYTLVAQRDWEGPLLAAAGILVAQAYPGRWGLLGSAALVALGATIRPHVVLFLPALALAIDDAARRAGGGARATLRAGLAWGLACGVCLLLLFAPLIAQGLVDDLVRGVRIARYGGGYVKTSPRAARAIVLGELGEARLLITFAAVALLALRGGAAVRRHARPWLAALALAVVYKPLHPVAHVYLDHPLKLFAALNIGLAAGLVLRVPRVPNWGRLAALAGLLFLGIRDVPRYCSMNESKDGVMILAGAVEWLRPPISAGDYFFPQRSWAAYHWDDYRRTLAYLRAGTRPETRVANVLRHTPFLALNGPSGRVSPFPAESGVLWLWQVDPKLEPAFVRALEASRDSVVVWIPDEKSFDARLQLPELAAAVRRLYRFEQRFGKLEVWRRKAL